MASIKMPGVKPTIKIKSKGKISPKKTRKFNMKQRGSANELWLKKQLLDNGALEVIKSGGSLGVFDLIALYPNNVICIQVKSGKNPKIDLEEEDRIANITDTLNTREGLYLTGMYICLAVFIDRHDSLLKFRTNRYYGWQSLDGVKKMIIRDDKNLRQILDMVEA